MGLLNRNTERTDAKPKAVKAAPVARPRVRLRPEEVKLSNRLTPKEKLAGYGLAAFEVVALTIVSLDKGLTTDERVGLLITLVGLALFGVCVRFTNRLGASLGGLGALLFWTTKNGSAKDLAYGFPKVIYAYPLIGFMLYLTFASARTRQKMMAERIANGDLVNAPTARKSTKPDLATTDSSGKSLAPKSKRYTPPKAAKKK